MVYVGHSQGTSQMFAALSLPETRDYIAQHVTKFIALAPIVYLANQEADLLKTMALAITPITDLSKIFDEYSILNGTCSETSIHAKFYSEVCVISPGLCKFIVSVPDADPKYDNLELFQYALKHIPAGSSTQNFFHYAQLVNERILRKNKPRFTMYDRGLLGNLEAYGQFSPPEMDLTSIPKQVKIRGFVGNQDKLGDLKDNQLLRDVLLKSGKDYKMYTYDNMGHLTFIIGKDNSKLWSDVIQEVQQSE